MNDIENKVFDDLNTAIVAAYPSASCESIYTDAPSAFPHICIVQEDSYNNASSLLRKEDETAVMFQIDIYTVNDKETAKSISAIIDTYMTTKGFRRTYCKPTPNLDRNVFRMTMRFKGIVSYPITSDGTQTFYVR